MSKMCVLNYTRCFIGKIYFLVLLHYKFMNYFRELRYCGQKFLQSVEK